MPGGGREPKGDGPQPGEVGKAAGVGVLTYPEPAKLPKQFKYADRMGVRLAVTIGPDEDARGEVSVKDLQTGEENTFKRSDVAAAIRRLLA